MCYIRSVHFRDAVIKHFLFSTLKARLHPPFLKYEAVKRVTHSTRSLFSGVKLLRAAERCQMGFFMMPEKRSVCSTHYEISLHMDVLIQNMSVNSLCLNYKV